METSKLIGPALDWAVAKCENAWWWDEFPEELNKPEGISLDSGGYYMPSIDWSQGGPIIEQEMLERGFDVWRNDGMNTCVATYERGLPDSYHYGTIPLIAAMRCYVASKLGNEVEIPEELK